MRTTVIIGKCLLQELLNRKHMTQVDLHVLTGISRSQINEYIKNNRQMSLPNAVLIMYALRCRFDELYEVTIIQE